MHGKGMVKKLQEEGNPECCSSRGEKKEDFGKAEYFSTSKKKKNQSNFF